MYPSSLVVDLFQFLPLYCMHVGRVYSRSYLFIYADMIEELISKGQQLDAVHFTYEVSLVDKFPLVPLLKSFLKDAKKVAASILEDPNNAG